MLNFKNDNNSFNVHIRNRQIVCCCPWDLQTKKAKDPRKIVES